MNLINRRPGLVNAVIIAITMVFVTVVLVVAKAEAEPAIELLVGQESPQTFTATQFVEVEDRLTTERNRERALLNTPAVFEIDPTVGSRVNAEIREFLEAVRSGAFGDPVDEGLETVDPVAVDPETTTTAEPTTTTTQAPTTTTSAVPPATDAEGNVLVDETTTTEQTTTSSTTTTTTVPRLSAEEQIADLQSSFAKFSEAIPTLVDMRIKDLDDIEAGGEGFFDRIEDAIVELAAQQMSVGIRDVADVQQQLLDDPPRIFIPQVVGEDADALDKASARVVALSIQPNNLENELASQRARDDAESLVPTATAEFANGEVILQQGDMISEVQLAAIQKLDLLAPEDGTSRTGAALLGAVAVLVAALFLWRIAPSQWSQPKHMALLGVLLVVAAAISRVPEFISVDEPRLAYLVPAAMLGYSAAILYDPRTALLTAIPMAIFTAISTQDPAITVYAAVATVAPIAFVSAVSSRRQLRLAVMLGAAVLAPVAGAVSWFFHGPESALGSAVAGFVGASTGGFIGQGLVSFLENTFRITTTVTLLDLTDRNHPALRLIEDRAPGTFNHSVLVGNLAGRAARAIGADPLFAQAAAFYHDLGKTEHPQYFIENQFGVSNPHDELEPAESASIIRRHVSDGLRLARQYRIPSDVAQGIEQHHGTGLMRYFYHQALDADPAVDPTLYRHAGMKPQRKEMAILMISDAVEGAARSLAQQEDPTADSLKKLVDSVVGEKLEDGQLDESALTYGDLSKVKQALVQALIGYYHTRIPYPGFPGARVERA